MSKSDTRTQERTAPNRQRVPVARGVLVYEDRAIGRELVGFEDVTDYDDLEDELATRGYERGAIYHLPTLGGSGSA